MTEAIRLVVWDLDETYWRGTLTEGGIQEYVQEHHDIVVELARRGIMSSICSKNDENTVFEILEKKGIGHYFVFPSIAWGPKGSRLATLVDTIQLRPASVMFIDDNPSNRAEAKSILPDIQVEDQTFIPKLLADPRFEGKDDSAFSRLTQYKLLETRRRDQRDASGNNEEFLRGCDIRVYIEYDVVSHIDRAIELINRTNQLNFTKRRLPEDIDEARRVLKEELDFFTRQAGLVKVVDKYGDYGFVGLFVTETGRREYAERAAPLTLRHFCFSCRTLGMLVEQWIYEFLGRPQLEVVGGVLTDLFVPRKIDWIRLVHSPSAEVREHQPVAPEIRVYGGCEANAIGVYLGQHTDRVEVWSNFGQGGLFVRLNSTMLALSAFDRSREEFASEAVALGLPVELTARDYFATAVPGTAFVFSCAMDAFPGAIRYRHRTRNWEIALHPIGDASFDFNAMTETEVEARIRSTKHLSAAHCDDIVKVARRIRAEYETYKGMSDEQREAGMRALVERVPTGSKVVFLLDHDHARASDGILCQLPFVAHYNSLVSSAILNYPYATTASFTDVIENQDEIQIGGNHYHRAVYLRIAQRLVRILRELPVRASPPSLGRGGRCRQAGVS